MESFMRALWPLYEHTTPKTFEIAKTFAELQKDDIGSCFQLLGEQERKVTRPPATENGFINANHIQFEIEEMEDFSALIATHPLKEEYQVPFNEVITHLRDYRDSRFNYFTHAAQIAIDHSEERTTEGVIPNLQERSFRNTVARATYSSLSEALSADKEDRRNLNRIAQWSSVLTNVGLDEATEEERARVEAVNEQKNDPAVIREIETLNKMRQLYWKVIFSNPQSN